MMETVSSTERFAAMRAVAVRALQARGYAVINRSKGVGAKPYAMVEIKKQGESGRKCGLKVTSRPQGRINFLRDADGTWKGLRHVELVLHVSLDPSDQNQVRLMLFNAETLLEAFNLNHASLVKAGKAHLPCWVSPQPEAGERFVGSGYERNAIWTERVPLETLPVMTDAVVSSASVGSNPQDHSIGSHAAAGPMEIAKAMFASSMGVSADQIEIEVRVKG